MVQLVFTCPDGTSFPVEFADEAAADGTWVLDREHFPEPMTPLGEEMSRLGRPGADRAYAGVGMATPPMFNFGGSPKACGYTYMQNDLPAGEEMERLIEGGRAMLAKYGSSLGVWHDYSLPRVKEACAALQKAGDDEPLAALAELRAYAMALTMVPIIISFNDVQLLAQVCAGLFGEEAQLVANELAQGFPNETVAADQELWQLGRVVQSSETLRAALASGDPKAGMAAARAAGHDAGFFDQLDQFLRQYGWRTEAWDVSSPTWNELGPGFWAQLRQMARPDTPSPVDALAAAADRRREIIAKVDQMLAGKEDERARFHRRVERLQSYVAIREERALWQLVDEGSLRHALLRRGEALVERGVIDVAGDIFYLTVEEIEAASTDRRVAVKERRRERDHWRAVTPPDRIGRTATPEVSPVDGAVVKGVPGARGVATGPARIVVDLADADRVEPGDVLVCVMTSPPWTSLFGITAAVVTDHGDMGSHPSIAAREYGIPCVVGTRTATTAIPDGAIVTVDGAAGTVTLT